MYYMYYWIKLGWKGHFVSSSKLIWFFINFLIKFTLEFDDNVHILQRCMLVFHSVRNLYIPKSFQSCHEYLIIGRSLEHIMCYKD